MSWKISWMPEAAKNLEKLPSRTVDRIIAKMDWYVAQEDPLSFAKRLTSPSIGTFRFRIGDYRVLCDVRRGEITILEVLAVQDRKNAY